MCDKQQLLEILALVKKFSQEQFGELFDSVILYGSYARGDYDEESDIDIMILANIDDTKLELYRKVFAKFGTTVDLKYDVFVSFVLRSKSVFEYRKNFVPFYHNVEKEGVVFHA